jgi:hypothetical protein
MLACTAPGWTEEIKPDRTVSIKEDGKPAQKCRVLKCWKDKNGNKVCQVQDVKTGEILTIQETQPVPANTMGSRVKAASAQIFHWKSKDTPPAGAPLPPEDAVVVNPPVPAKQSLLSRLFGSSESQAPCKGCCPNGKVCTPPTQVVQATAEPPSVGDHQESSGKLERWTAEDTQKAVAQASTRAEQSTQQPSPPCKQCEVAMPAMPMTAPVPSATIVPAKPPAIRTETASASAGSGLWARLMGRSSSAAPAAPKPAAPVPAKPDMPRGMGSVFAAGSPTIDQQSIVGRVVMVDGQTVMVEGNAGAGPGPSVPVGAPNAFTLAMPQGVLAQGPMPMPPMPPTSMPSLSMPMPMTAETGVPNGMGNAFTAAGTSRPIPADMSMAYYPQNAFQHGGMEGMPMRPSMPPVAPAGYDPPPLPAMAMVQQPPMAIAAAAWGCEPQTDHLIGVLRTAVLPSEREMAVDQLSRYDWRSQPHLVQALMHAAKSDPAASVRASCVRALGKMKINTLPVVQTVQALKSDSDIRVRQEVEQALAIMQQTR